MVKKILNISNESIYFNIVLIIILMSMAFLFVNVIGFSKDFATLFKIVFIVWMITGLFLIWRLIKQ